MIPTAHVVLGGLVAAALMMALPAVVYYYLIVHRRRRSYSVATSQYGGIDSSIKVSSAHAAAHAGVSGQSGTSQRSGIQRPLAELASDTTTTASSSSTAANCAWEQRRRRGIAAHSLHEKKDAGNEKPFGSSYYYAHNNTRAAGGYKDGLTMEDFTMNGPRLLSRGGKPVGSDNGMDRDDDRDDWEKTESMARNDKKLAPISLKRSVPISRYLWDDPGDAKKGIATLRIEELPGKHSTDPMIPWKDVSITKITAVLMGEEGLLVTIETATDVDYELRIPKLYGQVAEVEALEKPKRLLLRLKKKAGMLNKTNLRAWPHPQKKIS